jgi:uncharacterized repeat protein (TIGR01451 family)
MLQTVWQAPDGGTLNAEGGATAATWTPTAEGEQRVILVVSDGDRRFAQAVLIPVGQGEKTPTPSPLETFAPSETPEPTETATPIATPEGGLRVEVGKLADGDDDGGGFSNDETVTPGSDVTYLITIDNDSDVPVTVTSIVDSVYADVVCLTTPGEGDVIGAVIAPDDGDAPSGPGVLDGGADEIQCIFHGTAPEGSGHEVTNDLAAIVEDSEGNTATDHDTATITTS